MVEEQDKKKGSAREARIAAMDLLARREHSQRELSEKLLRRFEPEVVQSVIAALMSEGLQSDVRFGEAYWRQRSGRGYGPIRIRQELRQRGLSDQLIAQSESECEIDWYELLVRTAQRKFGDQPAVELKEKARRQRFLMYRGFSPEMIRDVLD